MNGHGEATAIVVGGHPFPHGNASAMRMYTLGLTWQAAGWRVTIVNDHPEQTTNSLSTSLGSLNYVNLGMATNGRVSRLRRRMSFGRRVVDQVKRLDDHARIEYLIVPSFFFTPGLYRAIRKNFPRVELVADVVERHDRSQFRRRALDPYFVRHRLSSWYAIRRANRVIAISTALRNGPLRSVNALVIPPCADGSELVSSDPPSDEVVTISYIGSPWKKDDLSSLLLAIELVGETIRAQLRIVLAGFPPNELVKLPGVTPDLLRVVSPSLTLLGRVDRDGVRRLLGESHYTYLLRDPTANFARFGFPSKIPESLVAGRPPITNLTSDLGLYLRDNESAILCAGTSPSEVAEALVRAVAVVRHGNHPVLRATAQKVGRSNFLPAAWAPLLRTWLDSSAGSGRG